jgi:hypothetical protein
MFSVELWTSVAIGVGFCFKAGMAFVEAKIVLVSIRLHAGFDHSAHIG